MLGLLLMNLEFMEETDSGGVGAKKGFIYQDYAAALYVLNMLRDKSLLSVRCEVTDDLDLVYKNYIEYIQVKTTASETSWTLTEFCKVTDSLIKGKKVKKTDSILHKSIDSDKHTLSARFRILSPRDIRVNLKYLKIKRSDRSSKSGREELLKSLKSNIKDYKSPNENGIEYWLDNAIWEVIPSFEQLELKCELTIMQAASDRGVLLDSNRHPQSILSALINNLTKKSAVSRVLNSTSDKSYTRQDFISWFNDEISYYEKETSKYVKVYTTLNNPHKSILTEFIDLNHPEEITHQGNKNGKGLELKYQMNRYRYNRISESIKFWLPEILLRPSELADSKATNFSDKINIYTSRINENINNLTTLIGRVLLHSIIRCSSKSQPIPALLYIDDEKDTCFDNIHIVPRMHEPDELWMGFSEFINSNLEPEHIAAIVDKFGNLLEIDFDKRRDKILDVKQDSYLPEHDIDVILDCTTSLDDHLDRFRFMFFIGYESPHLEHSTKDMQSDYKEHLITEVEKNFTLLVKKLIEKDEYYTNLHVDIYLYPLPCTTTFFTEIRSKLGGMPNA